MSVYEAAFLRERISSVAGLFLKLDPKMRIARWFIRIPKSPSDVEEIGPADVKRRHRAEHLRALFSEKDQEVAVVLRALPKGTELITAWWLDQANEFVVFGIDRHGPFKKCLRKRRFLKVWKPVRQWISFEELFLCYDGDPDTLVNEIYGLIADAIVVIEKKSVAQLAEHAAKRQRRHE